MLTAVLRRIRGIYLFCDWKLLRECDVLYISRDSDRQFVFEGQHYSPLIDSLQLELTKSGLMGISIALPYSTIIHNKTFGTVLQFNFSYLVSELKDKLMGIILRKRVSKSKEQFWENILRLTKAKVVISIHPNRDLVFVCRQFKISIFDLQHGVISGENYYSRRVWEIDPENIVFPDFLLWDQSSADKLHSLLAPYSPLYYIIGNPWIRRLSGKDKDDITINNLRSEIERKITKKHCILLTLQHGKGIVGIEDTITDNLIEVIQAMKLDCQWLIKLHPSQCIGKEYTKAINFLKKKFKDLLDIVEWDVSSNTPLPILMQLSTLHITFNSGSAIEAFKMGLCTGLLDKRYKLMESWFGDYMKNDLIEVLPEDRSELISWIYNKSKRNSLMKDSIDEDSDLAKFISDIQFRVNSINV